MPTRVSSLDDGYQPGDLSVFPDAVDDRETLYEAANNGETFLKQGLTYNAKRIIVDDASSFPAQGLIRVGVAPGESGNAELVFYGSRGNTIFKDLIRGFAGSRQSAWPAGVAVTAAVMAEHHNAVKDALINIETFLGIRNDPAEGSFNYKLREQEARFLTPKAAFFGHPRVGPPSLKVRFQNFSGGDVVRSFWDFGDGTYSNENSPEHVYATEGIYTVKLNVVTSSGGQGAATKYNYIHVSEEKKPSFFYIVIPEKIETALTANFAATDTIIPVTDTSEFPSQGVVVIGNEQIAYRNKTSTSFKTLVRGYGETDAANHETGATIRKAFYSQQTADARVASGVEPTATATVFKFVDQSDGQIGGRYWVFGDGETHEQLDPDLHSTTHTYESPGSYNATLLLVFADQRTKRVFMPATDLLTVI